MMWPQLQLDPVAQGIPCGSSAYPLDQQHLSHRVEGAWLILQQSLNLFGRNRCRRPERAEQVNLMQDGVFLAPFLGLGKLPLELGQLLLAMIPAIQFLTAFDHVYLPFSSLSGCGCGLILSANPRQAMPNELLPRFGLPSDSMRWRKVSSGS